MGYGDDNLSDRYDWVDRGHSPVRKEEPNRIQEESNCKILIETKICNKTYVQEENIIFKNKWNDGVKGKLSCYGLTKLRRFAKYKNIKGYTKYSKDELIELLENNSVDSDFPIRL